jgi:formylglycine-generating enzyme required for sulfatase activity
MGVSCNKVTSHKLENQSIGEVATLNDQSFGVATPMDLVKEGKYIPLYGRDSQMVVVSNLLVDKYPVTNKDFKFFVIKNERWRKSQIKKIFADGQYLQHWINDSTYNLPLKDSSPVTNVSWHVAKAYCECQGKRLPTVDEWEYIAMANQDIPDARKVKTFNQYILDWYEKPKNYWNIYDMHGLVWEWTSDFNSVLLSGESRNDVKTDKDMFCGSGSLNATDLMNYAAFMRYAFRGSMKAKYSVQNLGFRCVKDSIIN